MIELPISYLNQVADQIIFISALLCGFSLTVLVLLFDRESSTKTHKAIFCMATVSTAAFLVAIFVMTNILMMTTEGYPIPIEKEELRSLQVIGILCFFIGLFAVNGIIALSGWVQSKTLGWFTTVIGVVVLIAMLLLSIDVG